jgi:hypothetical protein
LPGDVFGLKNAAQFAAIARWAAAPDVAVPDGAGADDVVLLLHAATPAASAHAAVTDRNDDRLLTAPPTSGLRIADIRGPVSADLAHGATRCQPPEPRRPFPAAAVFPATAVLLSRMRPLPGRGDAASALTPMSRFSYHSDAGSWRMTACVLCDQFQVFC